MAKTTLFDKMQTLFGVSSTELRAVLILLAGVCIGMTVKIVRGETLPELYSLRAADNLYGALDSLAAAERTAFVGVDSAGNAMAELAKGDTVVRADTPFPTSKKKEMPASKINLNIATKAELMKLPGVGEATAEKIIEFRKNQRFRASEDIMKVKGIGQKKFEKMSPYLDTRQ